MPEYIEPLRKEIESVLDPDGFIEKRSFNQLVKLDSIMKESQRFNPLLLSTHSIFPIGRTYLLILVRQLPLSA